MTANPKIDRNASLEAAFDNVADGLLTCDQQGVIQTANRAAARMFGFERDELIGQNVSVLMAPEIRRVHDGYIAKYLTTGESEIVGSGREVSGRRKDGSSFPLYISVGHGRSGNAHVFTAVLQDRTESQRSQMELLEAKQEAESANRTKSEFLANISHELRTPLHLIRSYVRFGLEDTEKAGYGELRQLFQIIQESADVLLRLVNDLLDLEKLEARKVSYYRTSEDLRMIVADVGDEFNSLLSETQVSLCSSFSDQRVNCLVDVGRMQQLVRNLIANAVKFSPSGSEIRIEVTAEKDSAKLSIYDQGPGIPDDELELIFEKFVQSRRTHDGSGGTGLGLAICRQIVEGHSGKIWAENRPRGGAAFHVVIPVADHAVANKFPSQLANND